MKSRSTTLITAVVLALVATAAMALYLKSVKSEAATGGDGVSVIVSKQDIAAGTRLDPLLEQGMFSSVLIPANSVVQGAITRLDQLKGKTTSAPIVEGEQLTDLRLGAPASGGNLGIREGNEAVSVQLSTERTVAGTIRQNDHVTVYATFKDVRAIHSKTLKAFLSGSSTEIPQEAPRGTFTVTVVDDVRVLRVSGEGTDGTSTGGDQQVTLEVAPADAARIVFAQENGTLWLGLLPPGEDGTHTDPVQVGQLLR